MWERERDREREKSKLLSLIMATATENEGDPATLSLTESPQRFIYSDIDLENFLLSPAKSSLLRFTNAMGKSCASCAFQYNDSKPLAGLAPAIACLHGALQGILDWIDDFPPIKSPNIRFGNPAMKQWHSRLTDRSASIIAAILATAKKYPGSEDYDMTLLEESADVGKQASTVVLDLDSVDEVDREVVEELRSYLHDSFGHVVRLDFGTGHESSFQVFLFVLCKLHHFGSTPLIPPSEIRMKATTTSIYHRYLKVTRRLQTDYMLEPAGSHGVWGLDDYHCLPFYFGACQLQSEDHPPSSIHDTSILKEYGDTFLFFGCIRFIKFLKNGVPFFESSPMLNDISHLPTWSKIASGLLKLYEGEVLKKRQVVQHFRFGKIFSANWTPTNHETVAPTTTFRTPPPTADSASVKAPVSAGNEMTLPPTKAPWAK